MIHLDVNLVHETLAATHARIFTFAELSKLFHEHATGWTRNATSSIQHSTLVTAESLSLNTVIDAIVKARILEKVVLPFSYRPDTRYLFGKVDVLDLVQSLREGGYFTHFSAVYLNNLTEQSPKTVYFNVEQRASGGEGHLTEEALNRAFKSEPRMSSNVAHYQGTRIVKVNGRNTGRLGVVAKRRMDAGVVQVTDVERTLIDATVRPAYTGGIAVVARAFELAKETVSVNKLTAYLRKLRYVYPYHQAIGFYLERAGYGEPLLRLLEQFSIEYDFYLQHAMRSPVLNKRWRLYVPKGF